MAKKGNKPNYSARYRVVLLVEVPVFGATLDAALETAKALKLEQVARVDDGNENIDYTMTLEAVQSDRWTD